MIREQLKKELVQAMKNKEENKVATIRLINASIKDKDIEARLKGNTDGISENEIFSALQSMIKQRKDSIQAYEKGNRLDLVEKENLEIEIISSFLPQQLSAEETKEVIATVVSDLQATSIKDMGKVMAVLKEKYQGRMDFSQASSLIKTLLS